MIEQAAAVAFAMLCQTSANSPGNGNGLLRMGGQTKTNAERGV